MEELELVLQTLVYDGRLEEILDSEKGEGDEKIEEERIRKTKIEGKWGIEEEK